jgi:hypothetical protein
MQHVPAEQKFHLPIFFILPTMRGNWFGFPLLAELGVPDPFDGRLA